MKKVSRRDFISLMAVGGAGFLASGHLADMLMAKGLSRRAARMLIQDIDEKEKGALSYWARLRFRLLEPERRSDWEAHPSGDIRLIRFINQRSTANIKETWNVVDIRKLEHMIRIPFLFMHAQVTPVFGDKERRNLKEYLERGGFLFIDDCILNNRRNDLFFRAMKKELPRIFPEGELKKLDSDHPVFHCFFDMPRQPHMQGTYHGAYGFFHKKKMLAYITGSDLHCGWVTRNFFGARKQREALKMGTNIYLYAMTH